MNPCYKELRLGLIRAFTSLSAWRDQATTPRPFNVSNGTMEHLGAEAMQEPIVVDGMTDQISQLISEWFDDNPLLAEALTTLQIAEDEYRRSVQALSSVDAFSSTSTNE